MEAASKGADQAFWTWFAANADKLPADKVAAVNQIQAQLDKDDPDVFAEVVFDPAGNTLVLTADGKKDRFPDVKRIAAAAPKIAKWSIVAFRQRDHELMPLTMNGRALDPKLVKFTSKPNGAQLDIRVFIPDYTDGDEALGNLAFLALDHAVGEYDVETKLGGITLESLASAPPDAAPLAQLPAAVDALH